MRILFTDGFMDSLYLKTQRMLLIESAWKSKIKLKKIKTKLLRLKNLKVRKNNQKINNMSPKEKPNLVYTPLKVTSQNSKTQLCSFMTLTALLKKSTMLSSLSLSKLIQFYWELNRPRTLADRWIIWRELSTSISNRSSLSTVTRQL